MNRYVVLSILAFFILGVAGGIYFMSDKNIITIINNGPTIQEQPNYRALTFNGEELVDHRYLITDEICKGGTLGMNITITPCTATSFNGKNIQHDVAFSWNGASPQDTSWVFVYEGAIEEGSIKVGTPVTKQIEVTHTEERQVNNYIIDNVESYVDISPPTQEACDLGSENNTQMYAVTRSTVNGSITKNYCFTDVNVVNPTTFSVSGLATREVRTPKNIQIIDYTTKVPIEYLGNDLLGNGFNYYKVRDVTFNPDQTIYTRWEFTPENKASSGKWHIFGYNSALSITSAVESGQYIYIDPEWTSALDDELSLYYTMNETGTNIESVYGKFNATNNGSTPTVGIIGGAKFLNSSSVIQVAGTPNFDPTNQEFTISAWINVSVSSSSQGITSKFDTGNKAGFRWIYQGGVAGNPLSFVMYNNPSVQQVDSSATNIDGNLNNLTHVVVMGNASHITFFINGTRHSVHASTNGIAQENEPMGIGGEYRVGTGFQNSLQGNIDEVGYWNRSLTEAEISSLYNDGMGLTYGYTTPVPVGEFYLSLISPDGTKTDTNNIDFVINQSALGGVDHVNNTLFIWNSTGTLINQTTISLSGNDTYLVTFNNSEMPYDDLFYWNSFGCGENATRVFCNWSTNGNKTFTLDTTSPIINISAPNSTSFFSQTVPYNVTLRTNYSDVSPDACWYHTQEDPTNVTFVCNAPVNVSFGLDGLKTITYYANDTFGAISRSNTTFQFYYLNESLTYPTDINELENITIHFTLNTHNITDITGILNYNSTVYPNASVSFNDTLGALDFNYISPVVSEYTSKNFYINYTFKGQNFTTSIFQQNISALSPLIVDSSCSPAGLRFALKSERNFTLQTGSIDYNFKFGNSNNDTFKSVFGSLNSTNYLNVCVNETSSPNYTIGYGELHYTKTNYVDRRYYIFSGTYIDNATQTNITLHNLYSGIQTSFKLEVEDSSLNPYIENYTALLRWYPERDEYIIVEMGKTDEKGDTVIHTVAEDVDYRIAVYNQDGTLNKLEDPTRMICLVDPCTYTLTIKPEEADYTSLLDITTSLTYNYTTGQWRFIYSDPSQLTTLMNLSIYKTTGTSRNLICSDTGTSFTGVLSCNTSSYTGNLEGVVTRSASPNVPLASLLVRVNNSAFTSSFGLWLSLFIALPIAFIFAFISPIAAIFGIIIAMIPALYFQSINIAIIGGIAVLGGLVAHVLSRT